MKTERQARKTKMIFLQCLQTPDICKHPSTHKEITLAFETLALKCASRSSQTPNPSHKLILYRN